MGYSIHFSWDSKLDFIYNTIQKAIKDTLKSIYWICDEKTNGVAFDLASSAACVAVADASLTDQWPARSFTSWICPPSNTRGMTCTEDWGSWLTHRRITIIFSNLWNATPQTFPANLIHWITACFKLLVATRAAEFNFCPPPPHPTSSFGPTLRSRVWEMSQLLRNSWGWRAKLRKNSLLVFSWLMVSTVSWICNTCSWTGLSEWSPHKGMLAGSMLV